MKTLVYGASIRGNSHYMNGVECQDYNSFEEKDLSQTKINVISLADGHGGNPYFRSKIGAMIATKVSKKIVYSYVKSKLKDLDRLSFLNEEIQKNKNSDNESFKSEETVSALINEEKIIVDKINEDLKIVKKEIVNKWNNEVLKHLKRNPFSIIEGTFTKIDSLCEGLEKKDIRGYLIENEDFIEMINCGLDSNIYDSLNLNITQIYGTTCICVASYNTHHFIFQIGDGNVCVVDENDNSFFVGEKDDELIGNLTYSMCQKDAVDYFKAKYINCKDKIIMLSSDGIVNALDNEQSLYDLAKGIYSSILEEPESFRKEFKPLLRMFSKGSLDDCTICLIAKNMKDDIFNVIKESKEYDEILDSEIIAIPIIEPYNLNLEIYFKSNNDKCTSDTIMRNLCECALKCVIEKNCEILFKLKNCDDFLAKFLIERLLKKIEREYKCEVIELLKDNPLLWFDYKIKNFKYNNEILEIKEEIRKGLVSEINDKKIILAKDLCVDEYCDIIKKELYKPNIRKMLEDYMQSN